MDESTSPLYRKVLGSAFDALPARVRELHASSNERRWSGKAQVRRGEGILAKIVGALIGFPHATDDVAVSVTLAPEKGAERWTRNFGGKTFTSVQSCGVGGNQHLLVERFGAISVALALVVEGERLFLIPRRWSLFGLPLPTFLLPAGNTFESQVDGRFHFDVEICAPFVGLIVAYNGQLDPEA
jgi:hypothetical protein